MNMTMKSALSAIALAAGMLAGAAQASPVVTDYTQQNIATNLTAHVESLFDDPVAFDDRYHFTTTGNSFVSNAYLQSDNSESTITGFSIRDSLGHVVGTAGISVNNVTQLASPGTGYWKFSNVGLAANTAYYVDVLGTINDPTGSSYGFTINLVSAVPEPETYALMLAGLGLMGVMRRRKTPN